MSGAGVAPMACPMTPQPSPTLTIDVDSDPGSWAVAIAHTPHLAAQLADEDESIADLVAAAERDFTRPAFPHQPAQEISHG